MIAGVIEVSLSVHQKMLQKSLDALLTKHTQIIFSAQIPGIFVLIFLIKIIIELIQWDKNELLM